MDDKELIKISKALKQIAFYGKGGIGKSTVVSNIAAALADDGDRVTGGGLRSKIGLHSKSAW